jgi:hypothetical protein
MAGPDFPGSFPGFFSMNPMLPNFETGVVVFDLYVWPKKHKCYEEGREISVTFLYERNTSFQLPESKKKKNERRIGIQAPKSQTYNGVTVGGVTSKV